MESPISYTGLRQVPRMDLASVVPLSYPLTVHVEPTNICNFRCSFCPVSFPTYAQDVGFHQHMPMEIYDKVVSGLKGVGKIRALKFYFIGEPFLNPNLLTMIKTASTEQLAERIEITSNGSNLPYGILDSGVDYLRISIYSPNPSKITRNVRELVTMRNIRGLTKPFICVKYMPDGPEDRDEFLKTYEGVCDERILEGYHNWASTESLIVAPPTPKKNCPFVHYMMIVRANGDVVPCCVDWNSKLKLGSILDSTIKEIWDGEKRKQLVLAHVMGERDSIDQCAKCDLPDTTPDNLDSLTLEEYLMRINA